MHMGSRALDHRQQPWVRDTRDEQMQPPDIFLFTPSIRTGTSTCIADVAHAVHHRGSNTVQGPDQDIARPQKVTSDHVELNM